MAIQITRVWVLTVSAVMLCLLESSWISAATVEEIALMKSANREKLLIEGAKKEGKVVFYTGLIVDQVVRPVKDAFEKEYPFVQVEFFRANAERLAQQMLAEYQAKRYDVDIVSGSAAATIVQRAGFMQRFYSPPSPSIRAELKDPKGFWGSTNVYFMTLGYNTRSVKAAELAEELRRPAQSALERPDDVVDQPRLGRAAVHRQHFCDDGAGSREGVSAKIESSKISPRAPPARGRFSTW